MEAIANGGGQGWAAVKMVLASDFLAYGMGDFEDRWAFRGF